MAQISNEEELIVAIDEINERLQAVNDYLGPNNHESARIRFPRGYLRTCAHHRTKYSFLKDKTLQSNIAYAKMTTDIFRWMLNRTDVSLTAREMLIKQGISIMGSVAEAVLKAIFEGRPGGGNKQSFNKRIERLHEQQRLKDKTKAELEWLWDVRNNVHLMLLDEREYNKYSIRDYNRAILALRALRVELGGLP